MSYQYQDFKIENEFPRYLRPYRFKKQSIQNTEKQGPRNYKLMSETEFSRITETLKKSAKQLIQANDLKSKTNEN